MIEPIFNPNFVNTFHHRNVPGQRHYGNKHTGQKYQPKPLQISNNFSPPYLTEKCLICGRDNKNVREVLIQHDKKLDICPFRGLLFIYMFLTRENLLKNNEKHG